ncbi:MAG: PIN domain-containing protein [Bifidobacteriaceae bacterium]|nr:PIN domain-containing protein [Bifidobacteriaceae bacterium]
MSAATIAVDTSLAIPLLAQTHPLHNQAVDWAEGRALYLSYHAAVEVYSVLTRLPGDMRLLPEQAATVIGRGFNGVLALPANVSATVHIEFARAGIAGGMAYDALVALAARANHTPLATRDKRAQPTYLAVGAEVCLVAL